MEVGADAHKTFNIVWYKNGNKPYKGDGEEIFFDFRDFCTFE